MRTLKLLFCLTPLLIGSAEATIIGHDEVAQAAALSQATLDIVGQQRWLFTHASVGTNIIEGMNVLHAANPVRYQFGFTTAGDGNLIYASPATTVAGRIYDGVRGNPGWEAKFAMFDDAVRNLGWRYPKIDAAMDKLCYIDDTASVSAYLASMTALETSYPTTTFVYTTMPLQTSQDQTNVSASDYNQAVRQHCLGGGRLLLDVADIESHDPAGNPITFTYLSQTYERLYSGYTVDGGHLNATGSGRVALAWYMAASMVANKASAVPPATDDPSARITSIAPNPFNPAVTVRFALANAGSTELTVFDARGHLIDRLVDAELPAGEHSVTWRGCDRVGRAVATGVYLVRLTSGGVSSAQHITLAR